MTGFFTEPDYYCGNCGQLLMPGQFFCSRYATGQPTRDHVPRGTYKPFVPYWDEHISDDAKPVFIESLAHRQRLMKKRWKDDFLIQTDFHGSRGRGER